MAALQRQLQDAKAAAAKGAVSVVVSPPSRFCVDAATSYWQLFDARTQHSQPGIPVMTPFAGSQDSEWSRDLRKVRLSTLHAHRQSPDYM